ncbi:unnamed protein product [Arabidopsis lyrata]|uniref:Predicted protein n=1 Tax=Arabidopsis lyrata subsp. lyrata TaxID=81972 RepID=D7KEK6_ARALL|nr:ubiquitin domain-containing protein 2 [Arabidopsis lyrata subsp. lyrata]EFH66454.1 predicted protein [Arabidopsis lyrata subsp. lyrata]CAH8252575.1 unnamed protein product [Arabidopsis lyrata]|eukprot:XP_002890195.1 ubiquitin domain-containing protein 2 [Arabidopsis lyrata subsp. lyrata]
MGCSSSRTIAEGKKEKIRRPKTWKHPQPISSAELTQMREEFWDTAPHYGGKKEIWDALRAAAEEEDLSLAQTILESAGVIVQNTDLTICYDEKGSKYELPKYVLRDPSNLIRTK